jgi:hypothetical protein
MHEVIVAGCRMSPLLQESCDLCSGTLVNRPQEILQNRKIVSEDCIMIDTKLLIVRKHRTSSSFAIMYFMLRTGS